MHKGSYPIHLKHALLYTSGVGMKKDENGICGSILVATNIGICMKEKKKKNPV